MSSLTKYINNIDAYVQSHLSEKRYQHSLSTAQTAQKLAHHFGYPKPELAYIAGLGHDVAKELSMKQQIRLAKVLGRYDPIDKDFPMVVHGRIAAAIIALYTGYYCQRIDKAFCSHTTGRANMSALESILYIADFIEPHRAHMKDHSLDWNAFSLYSLSTYVLHQSITFIKSHGMALHPDTIIWHESL